MDKSILNLLFNEKAEELDEHKKSQLLLLRSNTYLGYDDWVLYLFENPNISEQQIKNFQSNYNFLLKNTSPKDITAIERLKTMNAFYQLFIISEWKFKTYNKLFEDSKKLFNENSKKMDNAYNVIRDNFDKIESATKDSEERHEELIKSIEELENQADELSKHGKEIKPILNQTKEQLDNVSTQAKSLSKKVSNIEDTKSSIYTDFIAILGVFSAFVFLMFGGIDTIRTALNVTDLKGKIPFAKIITLGGLVLIAVLIMLYSLLLWIARFTNREFGKCLSSACQNGCQHKFMHAFLRHSFFIGILVFLILSIIITNYFMK